MYTGSGRSTSCLSVVGRVVSVLHKMDSNVNIPPKMSYDVTLLRTELHAYDFVLRFCNEKKGALFLLDPIGNVW